MADLNSCCALPYIPVEPQIRKYLEKTKEVSKSLINFLTHDQVDGKELTLNQSSRSPKIINANYTKVSRSKSDLNMRTFEVESMAWRLISTDFNMQADFPGIRPYVVHPTVAQSPEQTQTWDHVSERDCADWQGMGNRSLFQGRQTLDVPWAQRLKSSVHGWKTEDGLPISFFGRLIHHHRAWPLTTGENFRIIQSFQKKVGSEFKVTVERPDQEEDEYDCLVEEEDRKVKEAEEEAEKLAAEAKEAEERKVAEEAKKALEKAEHPLIKTPIEKPDWLDLRTVAWIVANYSGQLPEDEFLRVLRRNFLLGPKP
ncbi:hypothetical protein BGAL_0114g00040 [Botrytis galanthina]|uniref:Uncharacterized protein n=1 Tax=Botrytis galanthina TaxID=278940 RepID=A0A4S8R3T3_9HELO|nr:hypothetical protein BGAL_0114g00040 [Botrytis galanthina]